MKTSTDTEAAKFAFWQRSAMAWQNYFDVRSLLPGIQPSAEQTALVQVNEPQLLIQGAAGSGKSITLIFKLLRVMEQEKNRQRILYLSFNKTLIEDARKRAHMALLFHEVVQKHDLRMETFHDMAHWLLRQMGFHKVPRFDATTRGLKLHENNLLRRVTALTDTYKESREYQQLGSDERLFSTHSGSFILEELLWIKANGYTQRDAYLNVDRTGRGNNPRLTRAQRQTIFTLFERYQAKMKNDYHGDMDMEDYALALWGVIDQIPESLLFDVIFVDEVQDLQPMQIKVLVRLAKKTLVLSGDPKQRIYKRSPHTYAELGLQLQGKRTRTLRVNYRSTRQIMAFANGLKFNDLEHVREDLRASEREGPLPEIHYFQERMMMYRFVVERLKEIYHRDPESSLCVIHRSEKRTMLRHDHPIKAYLEQNFSVITAEQYERRFNHDADKKPVLFTDAFSVKGLEFDYVFIIDFDRLNYPHQDRIEDLKRRSETINSDSFERDHDSISNDEKKVLYVALTRARKELTLCWSGETISKVSPFIRDFHIDSFEAYGFDKNIFCGQEVIA
ncbi:UvrD-helicase domain-containing protein [Heliobacterium undosum]|uniref:DNA 3'-5' helicase n=1 Tax=Heliomicrobium undosum TaxID=121734 RepID=A0A845L5R7_9FIRM|nr:UvrD-helicase domain-containing protein [Heliomicrobium undosum]MZP30184.1 UvrD-helicase domain-containing protein [Heliomicrobium undosum]